ncbi:MAG TPA: hypothetical protein VGK64_21965 [Bryobacteraceae bacterium]
MKQTKFPKGWNENRVKNLLTSYESQTEEEIIGEDEAGIESSATVMNIPYELVPQVRELIAKRRNE